MGTALIVLVLASGWRLLAVQDFGLSNFSPIMALAFCGGVYLNRRSLWLVPLAALFLSDVYIDRFYSSVYHYDWSISSAALRALCFAAGTGFGLLVSKKRSWKGIAGGLLASSFLFYFVTNTASWATDAGYAHSLAGWWQAMTVGHPLYPPTLFFFKNTIASDVFFTAAFSLAMEYRALRQGLPSLVAKQRSA